MSDEYEFIRADHPDYIHKDDLRKVLEGMKKETKDPYAPIEEMLRNEGFNEAIDKVIKGVCE